MSTGVLDAAVLLFSLRALRRGLALFFGPTTAGTGGEAGRALASATALAGFVLANRVASRTPPMRDAYRHWSDAALAFLAPLLFTLAPQVLFALAWLLPG